MAEDKTLDEVVDGVLKTATSPTTPQPDVVAKMTKLKIQRNLTNRKFLQHFNNVPKIIKSINDIKFANTIASDVLKKKKKFLQDKKQNFAARVNAAIKKEQKEKQEQQQSVVYQAQQLKQNQINLPVAIDTTDTIETTTDTNDIHLR